MREYSAKTKKSFYIVIMLFLAAVFIVGSVTIYFNEMSNRIYNTNVATLQELAKHDIKNVEAYISSNWNRLDYVTKTIEIENCVNSEQIMSVLRVECKTSEFSRLAVVDDKGNMYSDDMVKYQMTDESVEMNFIINNTDETLITVDDSVSVSEKIVYGKKITPIKVGDINIVAAFARCPVDSVEKNLRIESYDGKGYSVVFSKSGSMVVNFEIDDNEETLTNFYDKLNRATINSTQTVDDIKALNMKNESYILRITDENGVDKIIYSAPIKNTYWTFVIVVPYQVFAQQSKSLTHLNIILIIVVSAIMTLAAILTSLAARNAMKSKLDAQEKSGFLSNMSHEIRTPLNGIIGLNQLMLAHIDEKEKLQRYLSENTVTAEYLLSLVNDILDMSKLQANKFVIIEEPFSVDDMIETVYNMQSGTFRSNEIELTLEKNIICPNIYGDKMRLEQLLMNILGNAAKFTPSGGETKIIVNQRKNNNDNTVETDFIISDTGCGMTKEFQKKIFDMFSQERNKNSNSIKGTGLGMAISNLIIRQMGGVIDVESEQGKGSTFTVKLKSRISEIPQESFNVIERPYIDNNTPLNILLAEDNELNAEILTEILSDYNYPVTLAKNGKEAVDIFAASAVGEYNVILMDIQMPIMNGYDACKAIRKLERDDAQKVVIFACTANAFKEDERAAYESGMNDFITKPINVQILLEKLGR